jgi:hypothetical protein
MAAEAEMQSEFFDRAKAVFAAITRDGTVAAMGREAIKDIRNTVHEIYFGRGEHAGEPGAPLNPTQGEIAAARKDDPQLYGPKQEANHAQTSPSDIAKDQGGIHGPKQEANQPLPSPSDIAKDQGGVHGPQQKAGQELRPEAAQGGKEQPSPSPGDIAKDQGGVHGQEQPKGYWQDYEDERRAAKASQGDGNDQNERAEGRLKVNEELEQRREEERNRGREGR